MRALRWYGREDQRLEDGTEPSADPGQVVIEVRWCGICGTDLHEYLKGPIFVPTEPHPVSGIAAPLTLGHEFTGRIRRAGRRGQVAEGRRPRDRRRRPEMRPLPLRPERPVHPLRVAGFVGLASNGGMAATSRSRSAPCTCFLTRSLTIRARCWSCCRSPYTPSGAAGWLQLTRRRSSGAGPIGLVTLAAARAASAGEIFIVERATAGKDKARTGDAHHVIDPADGDPVQQIQALTPGGLGVDVACERVGHAVTLNVALEAIRKGGTAAIVGVFEEPSSVHFNDLVLSERTLVGVLGYVDDSPCAIALLADGRISADPLITSRAALDDAIEDGFRELVRNKDEHVKILINPSGVGSKPSPGLRPSRR